MNVLYTYQWGASFGATWTGGCVRLLTAMRSGVPPCEEVSESRFSRAISLLFGSLRARFSSLMLAWCFSNTSSDLSRNYMEGEGERDVERQRERARETESERGGGREGEKERERKHERERVWQRERESVTERVWQRERDRESVTETEGESKRGWVTEGETGARERDGDKEGEIGHEFWHVFPTTSQTPPWVCMTGWAWEIRWSGNWTGYGRRCHTQQHTT